MQLLPLQPKLDFLGAIASTAELQLSTTEYLTINQRVPGFNLIQVYLQDSIKHRSY